MNKKILAAFFIIASQQSFAEQWYFEPTASLKAQYDDNVRLSAVDKEDDYSALFTGDVYFGTRTALSDTRVHAQLHSIDYASLDDLDFTGGLVDLETDYRNGLNLFGLKALYDLDSTHNTELTETGKVFRNIERTLVNVSPSWQRQYTERATIFADYSYSDIRYEDNSFNYNDYWYDNTNLGMTYLLSEKTSVRASIGLSRFETESVTSSKYDSQSINLGFTHQISESSTGDFMLGYTETDSDFHVPGLDKISINDDSLQLEANYNKQFETMSFNIGLNASEQPSGEGRLLYKKQIKLGFKKQLNERLDLSLDILAYQNETGGGISLDTDSREYFSIRPQLRWRATEWWTIITDYRYIHSENPDRDFGAAEANRISITARYIWPKENVSRWMDL